MENLSAVSVHGFGKRGRCYGLFIRVFRQAYVLGASERGIFYRFGIKITETKPGQWNTLFGIRTKVGIAELMVKIGMKDEILPIHFRPNRIRGSLHFSRTGVISFVGGSRFIKVSNKVSEQLLSDNYQTNQGDNINRY